MWNKINLRGNNKNLPNANERVLWATNEGGIDRNIFYHFIGELTTDKKHIDYGYGIYKLTSNYWWRYLPENPSISK